MHTDLQQADADERAPFGRSTGNSGRPTVGVSRTEGPRAAILQRQISAKEKLESDHGERARRSMEMSPRQ